MTLTFAALLTCLALTSFACVGRAPPLSTANLRVSIDRSPTSVEDVGVTVEYPNLPCGALPATVELNGMRLRQVEDGTSDRGSHYFIPYPGCLAPYFEWVQGTDTGAIAQGVPLELTLTTDDEVVHVRHEDVLRMAWESESLTVRAGEVFRFRQVGTTSPQTPAGVPGFGFLSLEGDKCGEPWLLDIVGLNLSAQVPETACAGTFVWSFQAHYAFTPTVCTGVATCEPISGSIGAEGTVTVTL